MSGTTIYAVTVNHNTSHFVELMLRTLFHTNDLSDVDLQLFVLDNDSHDDGLDQLQAYLAQRDIHLIPSGFDSSFAPEKHAAAYDIFVAQYDGCSHYLFMDSDMWFVEENTIPVMVSELLDAPSSVFANQARIYGYYAHRIIEGRDGVPGVGDVDDYPTWQVTWGDSEYTARLARRCSPVCSLLENSAIFRRLVETIGLGRAVTFEVGSAKYFDTFSLMTYIMATHGMRFIVSSKRVNHFTMTGYQPEARGLKDSNCLTMLEELRSGRGMGLDLFRESDWRKPRE